MSGSLQIKNNTYYSVIHLGHNKYKWVSTGIKVDEGSKRAAQKTHRKIVYEYEQKKIIYSEKMLFDNWIIKWLEQKKNEVELNTWEAYDLYAKKHIIPFFQERRITLSNISPQHIQEYYNSRITLGLSANSIKKHNVVIRGALQDALKKNLIAYNPADRATLPKLEKFTGSFYTADMANQLLDVIEKEPIKPVILLTLFYGLRRSEVLGLKWNAVDFKNDTIEIKNTVVRVQTVFEKDRTKNKKSHRTMPLIPEVKVYLKSLQKEQKNNRFLFGNEYLINDHICVWSDGKPFSPDYITHRFKRILEVNNLPIIRFHDLRHTTASILLSKGFSLKEIQEWLGHSDLSTTADIYGHLEYKEKIKIAENMGNLLNLEVK